MLGVSEYNLANYGAVSQQVAEEMALGALKHAADAQISVAVTGIAGPSGGSADKPVGLVYIACAYQSDNGLGDNDALTIFRCDVCHFDGDRDQVRMQSAAHGIQLMIECSQDRA